MATECARSGMVVGPVCDLSASNWYNLLDDAFLEYALFLANHKRCAFFGLAPPCTTMSPARQPPLRSSASPYGFHPRDPATQVGTALGLRALGILVAARRNGLSGALEYPRRSYLRQLPPYQQLLRLPGIVASWVACCGFTHALGGGNPLYLGFPVNQKVFWCKEHLGRDRALAR